MNEPINTEMLDAEGPAAPPRENGELVFGAPWESRLFGLTMALYDAGHFAWDDFRRLLIEEIGEWDRADHPDDEWNYYERWAVAFERLLDAKGICGMAELGERIGDFTARPHGHDH